MTSNHTDEGPGHQHGSPVQITLDSNEKTVADGVYHLGELKQLLGVPQDYELDLVVNGEFKPLNDQRSLHVKGGEIFVSHVRQGGSS